MLAGVSEDVVDVFPLPTTLNCSGTVSAIEYCYNGNVDSLIYGMRYLVIFTLITLEQENLTFTITDVIPVHAMPTPSLCSDRNFSSTTVRYCCDSLQLNTTHQFNLPALNFAFGMIRSTSRRIHQLRYRSSSDRGLFIPEFLVEQYSFNRTQLDFDAPRVGDTFTLDDSSRTTDRGLRVFQFLICE